jgi:putative holliday junction resolvase
VADPAPDVPEPGTAKASAVPEPDTTPVPGPVLGVDLGEVRVGLAISDPTGTLATPLSTLDGGDHVAERLAAAAAEHGCRRVVVGLPRGMSGRDTAATARSRVLAATLRARGLLVTLWDERLSSVEADRVLSGTGRREPQRRAVRDRVAATIILQSWLDAQPPSTGERR